MVLNISAPAVACTWVAWLATSYRLYVTWPEYLAMALSVWIIYTLDGLFDARNASGHAGTARRDFHAAHSGWFWLAVFLAFGLLLGNALSSIGSGLLLSGMILAGLVAVYLTHAQTLRHSARTWLPKEIFGGVVFAMGVGLVLMEAHGRGAVGPISTELAGQSFGQSFGSGLLWLAASVVFLIRSIFSEPAVPLLALLFTGNCLLTARHEADQLVDPASARRLAPALLDLAPVLTAALATSSTVNAIITREMEMRLVHAGIALSAGLMLGVHLLAKRRKVSGAMAAFLLDVALLSPLILLPWNRPV